ncbi:MAG: ribbon-helix-helix domain-containing protein [Sphingobium sp.]
MDKPVIYAAPVKHSVTIAGHQTSISLEPVFWAALRRAAVAEDMALNALIAHIDTIRIASLRDGNGKDGGGERGHFAAAPNLASAIRCWLWIKYCE